MRPSPSTKLWVASAVAGAVVVAVLALRGESGGRSAGATREQDADAVPWCAPGLEPIAGGGCFAAPAAAVRGPTPLVVYLHGRHAPANVDEELRRQSRVAKQAVARGIAVLALRGKQGECTDPMFADYWCWPSNERSALDAKGFVDAWAPALAAAEKRTGKGPRMVLGFSNGGYFTTLLATRGLFAADAFTIAGAGPVGTTVARGTRAPILLVTADDDPSNEEMIRLSEDLTQLRWPHQIVAREGGHELVDWDIDMALTFFVRTRTEKLPLEPPLSTRAPRHREPSVSASASASAASSASGPAQSPIPPPDAEPIPEDAMPESKPAAPQPATSE